MGVIWAGTVVPKASIDRTVQISTESQENTELLQLHAPTNRFCISYPYNLQREMKQKKFPSETKESGDDNDCRLEEGEAKKCRRAAS